jgi:hypothetical protein
LPKEYEVLSRKSVFARDRVSRLPTTSFARRDETTAPSKPVLIGIVLQQDGCVAVMEAAGAGRFTELHPGDKIPDSQATVLAINLDYMELAAPGDAAPKRVYIGHDIEGAEAPVAATMATTAPAGAPIEGDDLLSRMRRRRQQEMNR